MTTVQLETDILILGGGAGGMLRGDDCTEAGTGCEDFNSGKGGHRPQRLLGSGRQCAQRIYCSGKNAGILRGLREERRAMALCGRICCSA